jgi:hypothetical protein
VKDDVSITTCGAEDLKESWQWVGKKKILLSYFVDGDQNCCEKVVSIVHNGYFENLKNLKRYIESVDGKTFTKSNMPKKTKPKTK